MRLPKTKITLFDRIHKTRIIIDRFLRAFFLTIRHIDHSITMLSGILRLYAKGMSRDEDTSRLTLALALRAQMLHTDDDASELSNAVLNMFASLPSVDNSLASARPIIGLFSRPERHCDIDQSDIRTMQVRPVFLGDLSAMTLGNLSTESLSHLLYEAF